jgi:hypothetical protein
VQVGEFNDDFIEVKSGLKEGERVLLNPPEIPDSEQAPIGGKPPAPEPKRPSNVAAQPAQPARN